MAEVEFCPCCLYRDEIDPRFLSADGRCTALHAKPKLDEHGAVILNEAGQELYEVCREPLGAHPTRAGTKATKSNINRLIYSIT
jgi:hypothetical protein